MNVKSGLTVLIIVFLLAACGSKKKPSMSGEDPVEIGDFIESFTETQLPFTISDSSLSRKPKDSMLIAYTIFTQFVPDSILIKMFGKGAKPKIYPLGRITEKSKGHYMFLKAIDGTKRAAYVIYFDKKDNFVAGAPVLIADVNPATRQSFTMDKRYTLSKMITRKNADGGTSEGKDVYVLNEPAKSFMLIMTDALDEGNMEVVNPIDSFSRKHKFAGDYTRDKKNIISIRDHKKADRITFFVHFEKAQGTCTGELKGEATFTSANTAEYRNTGDPCVVQFTFGTSSVTMKEIQGCGSYRGIDCLFEGNFPKKKEAKPKSAAKKTAK